MTTILNIENKLTKLHKCLSKSFSEFHSVAMLSSLKAEVQYLKNKGYDINLETKLSPNKKYFFKTTVLDINQYLGFNDNSINLTRIFRFLNEETKKAIEAGDFESVSIVKHIEKQIKKYTTQNEYIPEIIELFQFLPPCKLMKQDLAHQDKTINITIITDFEPYLDEMVKIL